MFLRIIFIYIYYSYSKPTTDSNLWPKLLNGNQSPKVKELNAFNFNRVFDNPYQTNCENFFKDYYYK